MKNYRLLASLVLILLACVPVLANHDMTGPLRLPSQVTQTTLFSGEAHLVGTVIVRKLPTAIPSASAQNALPVMYPQGVQAFAAGKNQTEQPGYVPPGEGSKTIDTASVSPQTLPTTVNLVLPGVPGGSPNPCGCYPPDPNNAVGPNHVFEMANLAGIIYLKNGTLARSTFSLSSFLALSSSLSDPQILYDSFSGRWFASIVDISIGNVQVAVSTSNDPTGTWNLYSFSAGGFLPDQPYIGTSDDKFGITANDFLGNTFVGVQYWIANKSELVTGAATIDFSTSSPDSSMHTLRPVRHLTTTSQFYLVTNCIGSCATDTTGMSPTKTVELLTASGTPPGPVSIGTQTFSLSATSVQPPNAAQPGTRALLVTNDNAILSAVWESGVLWLAWADSCVPSGETTTRSCVHLVEATVSGTGAATKSQDFDFASKGGYLFYPSISLYHGQLVLVYGSSSATLFPSLFVTGRSPSDPVNTLETSATIRTGTAADLSGRYGDYFGAASDPTATDNSTFWVSGEYRASSTSSAWSTEIAQVGSFAPDFTISANPSNITLALGSTGNSTVTIRGYKFTGTIGLSAIAAPQGLSCNFNPTVVSLGVSTTSLLSCNGTEGNYNVTLTGTTGGLSRSLSINATVKPPTSVGGTILGANIAKVLLPYAAGAVVIGVSIAVFLASFLRKRNNRMKA